MVTDEIIKYQYEEAARKFTKLSFPVRFEGCWIINGNIDVIDDEGGYWDTYNISIVIPSNYPSGLPMLYELGNKIKQEANWHNTVGICCLSTPAKMFYVLGDNITLLRWLELFAHPYLANHVHKTKTGEYAGKEYDHGANGLIQGYYEVFGLTDPNAVLQRLSLICDLQKFGRNDPCFCRSGKKYKKCFLIDPVKHRLGIPIEVLTNDLNEINRYVINRP